MSTYAELHCLSNFSFLRGASHPEELVERAHQLGYAALALTDECSLAGIVRAHVRAKELGLKLIIGTEVQLSDGPKLVLLARNRAGYHTLCRLITRARRASPKGRYQLDRSDLAPLQDCLLLLIPNGAQHDATHAQWLAQHHAGRAWIGIALHRSGKDQSHLAHCTRIGRDYALPLVACGDVHMHVRERRIVQDTLCAIRHQCTLQEAGLRLFPNGERHLREPRALSPLYPSELLSETLRVADLCQFSLEQLQYRYPAEDLPPGLTANEHLRQLTEKGLRKHWPDGAPKRVRALIEKELKVIKALDYPHYFLTVYDIMRWAKSQGILCQGRGSAANSAVCFALGITVVSPDDASPLFERFISAERKEPPDIDVDFEHQRREEVFQYIYRKYGRQRAALTATVIRYRNKSALRDVGKALGFSTDDLSRINQSLAWWDQPEELPQRLAALGFDPAAENIRQWLELSRAVQGFPRHLSQHVGGFVISESALDALVPIENAGMPERTVIQWEKDDLDAVGLFKIDCLALGMLTAIRKCFALIEHHYGRKLSRTLLLAQEKQQGPEVRAVYNMLGQAQSVGVFQVESRAQMSMLPRMKPRNLYDLTVETAIVRPGPIQGGMVHPYLERRTRVRANPDYRPAYPAQLKEILGRTYGIPIFQEQVMEVCVVGAGFAPGEADRVRRSMAAWGRSGYGKLERFEAQLKQGFQRNGISTDFAQRIFEQIKGFADYGFPESHAASFAALVYVSAWLKRHHPAAFLAALLNSQPMGFYTPSQLVQDFRRHHQVQTRPPDVVHSQWESTLEYDAHTKTPAVRLGLHMIKGLNQQAGQRIAKLKIIRDAASLFREAHLSEQDRQALARADALRSLTGSRHQAHWHAQIPTHAPACVPEPNESRIQLQPPEEGKDIVEDYASLGLTLRRHPLALLRPQLTRRQAINARRWRQLGNGRPCRVAGLVTNRQRPGSAQGIIFMTLEDETGTVNLVIRQNVLDRHRLEVLQAPLVIAVGINEHREGVSHLLVDSLEDHSHLLGSLTLRSRDFH
ncbi:MAG: DNA polymerase III subunit alpha [Oceanococcus sp.]|nr:MAG: DNA polymerase III subunit alpha [Oceanococcus sp.]